MGQFTKLFSGFNRLYIVFSITILLYVSALIQVLKLWINYASLDLYNYLTITPIVLFIVYTSVLKDLNMNSSWKKYLAYIVLYSSGSFLVFLSTTIQEFADQMIILGGILLIHSITILYVDYRKLYKALLLTLPLFIMIPLPQATVFELSAILTRIVLSLAIPLTRMIGVGLNVVETSGYILVNVPHNDGYVQFNIAPICSGVIGLFSVLAVAPLIIYVSLNGKNTLKKRVVGGVVGILLLAFLMFIANVVRLILVFIATSAYGLETGYSIFHYTPEIVMVIPIVLFVVKIIDRIAGNVSLSINIEREKLNTKIAKNNLPIAIIPLLLLIPIAFPLLNIMYQAPHMIFVHTYRGPIMLFNVTSGEKEEFIPVHYQGITINYLGRQHEMEEGLGPNHRIHFYRAHIGKGKYLDIYVEFARKPTIHIWELCLWWQNITVYYDRHYTVIDPSGEVVFSVKELKYSGRFVRGYLVSWRNKYYTESGLELARFTIMLNSLRYNITDDDISFVRDLANKMILRSIEACYAKYSKNAGFELGYYYKVVFPIALITSTIYLANKWIHKNVLSRFK